MDVRVSTEVHRPDVPYIGHMGGTLAVGTQVTIEGHIPSSWSERFDINFVHGHNPSSGHVRSADICFHFNPRFEENSIVLNTRKDSVWNREHRENGDMPMRKGEDFQLIFEVEEGFVKVIVNGQHFTNFPHRMPFNEAGVLWIDGRVDISKIEYERIASGGGYQPAPQFPPGQSQANQAAPQFPPGQSQAYQAAPQFPPGQSQANQAAPQFPPGQSQAYQAAPQFPPGQSQAYPAAPQFAPGQFQAYPPAPNF